ncbi:MAG: hypothetical protein DYG89_25350 [Caldilinea sp. CFX5]|nr:hypothetical protein [Caldilinea sp. CFX5]
MFWLHRNCYKEDQHESIDHDWLTKLYDPAMATLFQERLYRLPLIAALNPQPGQRIKMSYLGGACYFCPHCQE